MRLFILITSFCLPYLALSDYNANLSDSANCFTVDFYKKMGTSGKSMVSSPFSAYVLLSMLRAGAGGTTAQELTKALGYQDLSVEEMRDAFYTKLKSMESSNGNTLDIANSVWIENGLSIKQSFKDMVTKDFLSQVYSVDFASDPSKATQEINDWTNTSTHGMISKLFDDVLSPSTVMVLANAIFFNGTWQKQFETDNTQKGKFYNKGSTNDVSTVDMMYQKSKFNYKYDNTLNAQVLQMFYVGKDVSMTFILPEKGSDMTNWEKTFTCDTLKGALDALQSKQVKVTLPKFNISSKYDLVDSMKAVGIVDAFQGSADFSGISPGIKISQAIQKCVVKVYEQGSQAAVVTGITMMKMSAGGPTLEPEIFTADRPFLFMIFDHRSNLILFMGRVDELPNSN